MSSGSERACDLIEAMAQRYGIEVPSEIETVDDFLDEATEPFLEALSQRIAPGARLEGGDLVIDATSAEFAGFLAEPNRVLLRLSGFDVALPDDQAKKLCAALLAKLYHGKSIAEVLREAAKESNQ